MLGKRHDVKVALENFTHLIIGTKKLVKVHLLPILQKKYMAT